MLPGKIQVPLSNNTCKMYQKDYILRMIEMAGRMIAAILGLIKKGELTKASVDINILYYDFLQQDAAFFRDLPPDRLTETLLQEHNYTNGHLEILADLFSAEAELCLAQNNRPGSIEYSNKALILMEFIDKEYKTYSQERIGKMDAIRKRL